MCTETRACHLSGMCMWCCGCGRSGGWWGGAPCGIRKKHAGREPPCGRSLSGTCEPGSAVGASCAVASARPGGMCYLLLALTLTPATAAAEREGEAGTRPVHAGNQVTKTQLIEAAAVRSTATAAHCTAAPSVGGDAGPTGSPSGDGALDHIFFAYRAGPKVGRVGAVPVRH